MRFVDNVFPTLAVFALIYTGLFMAQFVVRVRSKRSAPLIESFLLPNLHLCLGLGLFFTAVFSFPPDTPRYVEEFDWHYGRISHWLFMVFLLPSMLSAYLFRRFPRFYLRHQHIWDVLAFLSLTLFMVSFLFAWLPQALPPHSMKHDLVVVSVMLMTLFVLMLSLTAPFLLPGRVIQKPLSA